MTQVDQQRVRFANIKPSFASESMPWAQRFDIAGFFARRVRRARLWLLVWADAGAMRSDCPRRRATGRDQGLSHGRLSCHPARNPISSTDRPSTAGKSSVTRLASFLGHEVPGLSLIHI